MKGLPTCPTLLMRQCSHRALQGTCSKRRKPLSDMFHKLTSSMPEPTTTQIYKDSSWTASLSAYDLGEQSLADGIVVCSFHREEATPKFMRHMRLASAASFCFSKAVPMSG